MASSFASEVRKLVLRYALLPVLAVYVVLSLVVVFVYGSSIKYSTRKSCSTASLRFNEVVSSYKEELEIRCNDKSLDAIIMERKASNEFSELLYEFRNSQNIEGHFFLIDRNYQLVLGSSTILSDYLTDKDVSNSVFISLMNRNPFKSAVFINGLGNARTSTMVFSIGQAVVRNNEIIGYLVFELPPQEILDYISSVEIGDLIITNSYFTSLMTSKNEYIDKYSKLKTEFRNINGFSLSNSKRFYECGTFIDSLDVWVICIVQMGLFSKMIITTTSFSLVLFALSIVIITNRSMKIVTDQAALIDKIIVQINQMKDNGLYTNVHPVESSFSSLESSYQQLLNSIIDLAKSNTQEVLLRERAEIRQLESQFNPHFIFNTLEIIRCLIKTNPEAANRIILDFSSLLRYSIDVNQESTTLGEDIGYSECYLSMNKLGKPNMVEYCVNLPKNLENVLVPKLFLQPIIENSLKYSPKNKKLVISIDVSEDKGNVVISVSDNGNGIIESNLSDIEKVLESDETPHRYFGLFSIKRRLKLKYGSASRFSIDTSPDGTTVTLSFPMEERCLAYL